MMYDESEFQCVACDSSEAEALGTLGSRMFVRCRHCGIDQFIADVDDECEEYAQYEWDIIQESNHG